VHVYIYIDMYIGIMIHAKCNNIVLHSMEPETINEISRTRLADAMQDVRAALQEQRIEVQRFRETMDILAAAVDDMQKGWQKYDGAVGRLDVGRLGRRARRLARLMSA